MKKRINKKNVDNFVHLQKMCARKKHVWGFLMFEKLMPSSIHWIARGKLRSVMEGRRGWKRGDLLDDVWVRILGREKRREKFKLRTFNLKKPSKDKNEEIINETNYKILLSKYRNLINLSSRADTYWRNCGDHGYSISAISYNGEF